MAALAEKAANIIAIPDTAIADIVDNFTMPDFLKIFCASPIFSAVAIAAAAILSACASAPSADTRKAPTASTSAQTYTFAQKKLLEIVAAQKKLLEHIGETKYLSPLKNSDLLSEKKRVDSLWNEYFTGELRDADSYAIYGKYLRATSDSTSAYAAFLKADSLDPTLASVKHQLAVYESENGQINAAYNHFLAALKLDPENPVYLSQTAKFLMLAKETLVNSLNFDLEAIDKLMLDCYRKWSDASPLNSPPRWERAKAYYQLANPDWQEALAVWDDILKNSTLLVERQTALANKARILIELHRDTEARAILSTIDNPNLSDDKSKLIEVIDAEAIPECAKSVPKSADTQTPLKSKN